MRQLSFSWLVGVSLALLPLPAGAARVTWHLSGIVSSANAELNSLGVSSGTPFIADITYQSSTPPSTPGNYPNAVLSVSFQAAAYSFVLSPPVSNGIFAPLSNYFSVSGGAAVGISSPFVLLELFDTEPANGASLPLAPPLYFGTGRTLTLRSGDPDPALFASGFAITYSVPEPTIGLVPFTLLVGVLAQRRRSASSEWAGS